MSEFSQPVSPDEAQNASNKLARLQEYKAAAGYTTSEETVTPHLQLVTSESAPALPQRVRSAEAPTLVEEQLPVPPSRQRIDESNAQEFLDKLRASQDYEDSTPVENEPAAESTGKRIDATVAVDSVSRAPEFSGEHRAGQHVDTNVEVDSDSRADEAGGKHRAGTHVAEAEVTSDSEAQTGGEHLAGAEASVQTADKSRKFGAILRRFLKISNR